MYFESPPKFRGLQRVTDNDTRSSDAFLQNLGLLDQENDTTPVGRVTCVRDSTICDLPTPLSTPMTRSTLGLLSENQTGTTCKGVVVAEDDSPVLIRKSISVAAEDDDLAPTPPIMAESAAPTTEDGGTPAKERSSSPDNDDVGEGDNDVDEESVDDDHELLFPKENCAPANVQPAADQTNADDRGESEESDESVGNSRSVRIPHLRPPTEMMRKMAEDGVDTTVLSFEGCAPLALLKAEGGKAVIDVPIGAAFSSWNECAEMANMLRRVGAVLEEALTHKPTDREMRAYNRAKSDYEVAGADATLGSPPTDAPTLLGGGMLWEDFAASRQHHHAEEDIDDSSSTSQSEVESSSASMGIADSEDESFDDVEEEEEEEEELDTASPPRTKWRRAAPSAPAADKGSPEPKRAAPKTKRPRKVDPMPIPSLDTLPTMLRTQLVNCKMFPLPQEMAPDQWDAIRSGLNGWTVHALKSCCRDWGVSRGVLAKGKQSLVSRILDTITATTSGSWPVEEEVEVSQLSCVNTDATDADAKEATVTEDPIVVEKEADTEHTEVAEVSTAVENEGVHQKVAELADENANEVVGTTEHAEAAKVNVFMGDSDDESASPQRNESECSLDNDEEFSSCQSTSDSDEVI